MLGGQEGNQGVKLVVKASGRKGTTATCRKQKCQGPKLGTRGRRRSWVCSAPPFRQGGLNCLSMGNFLLPY